MQGIIFLKTIIKIESQLINLFCISVGIKLIDQTLLTVVGLSK